MMGKYLLARLNSNNPLDHRNLIADSCPEWLRLQTKPAVSLGEGWAAAASLDWNKPLADQLSPDQCNVDLIIACDCVWLVSMLQGLFATLGAIFEISKKSGVVVKKRTPRVLLSFQRRDSDMFTTVHRILNEIKIQGWDVQCLAWYPVIYEEEGNTQKEKEVFLFEISTVI